MSHDTRLRCACGQVHISVRGAPIIGTACHCASCREAANRLASLPVSLPMQAADDATHYLLYRKDRVGFPDGTALLREFRLSPTASTRRVLTACCHTPVFLEFKGGHWLSLYRSLWQDQAAPPIQLRTMTADVPLPVSRDLPSGGLATASFYGRLLTAWIAMGFAVPAITTEGAIDA